MSLHIEWEVGGSLLSLIPVSLLWLLSPKFIQEWHYGTYGQIEVFIHTYVFYVIDNAQQMYPPKLDELRMSSEYAIC